MRQCGPSKSSQWRDRESHTTATGMLYYNFLSLLLSDLHLPPCVYVSLVSRALYGTDSILYICAVFDCIRLPYNIFRNTALSVYRLPYGIPRNACDIRFSILITVLPPYAGNTRHIWRLAPRTDRGRAPRHSLRSLSESTHRTPEALCTCTHPSSLGARGCIQHTLLARMSRRAVQARSIGDG